MGVPGLWKVCVFYRHATYVEPSQELAPAAKVRSLTELAVVEGFEANPNGSRGFRIGIDASIWFFHAAYGKEGENPELRTMFFRCATLMHAPFLPLFVFDGPRRPNVKRGKKINRELHKLAPGMKQIVESFGFEWRTAPDDVDNFLFGATTVIRNPSNNLSGNRANPVLNSEGRDDKNHTRVYRMADITDHPDVSFTRGDMIFIGLCSGGDYDTSGMTGCGPNISKALVRYGFGRSLYQAAKNLPRDALPAFLHEWRNEIRHELRTDSKGYIGSKRRALASSLPDAFPDTDILLSYVNPITSESAGRASDNLKLTWAKEPDLGKLAGTCEFYFEWGYRDAIIKRFKTVIWHGAVLRILRRAILDLEEKRRVPSTPTKNKGRPEVEGTPSKLITKHFSSLTLNPAEIEDDDRLITRITRTRQHAYTDGILEYRLEIQPRHLVLLAESGIKNIRRPLDADPWAGLTESGNEGGAEEKEELTPEERRAREEKEVLVWMPASMVRIAEPRLVEEFEQREEAKRLKKAGKGTAKRKPKTAKAALASDDELSDAPKVKAKPPAKKAVRKAKPPAVREEEESDPVPPKKAKPRAPPPLDSDLSSDDELPTFQFKTKAPVKGKGKETAGSTKAVPSTKSDDPFAIDPPARVVRDLTKSSKGKAVASGSQMDLKNFFPLAKAMGRKVNLQTAASAPSKPALSFEREQSKTSSLSAPTPARQMVVGPPRLKRLAEEESEDDVRRPVTPSKIQGPKKVDVEETCTPSKMLPRPFPLSFEDRPHPRRRSSITSSDSDSDSRQSRLTKSPRKSAQHTSPREKSSAARAPSPTPYRCNPPPPSPPWNLPVIDISSDSDSLPPTPKPKSKPRRPVPKAVLQPTNEIIDLSDL
ncbi:hypothetical protein MVEN_01941200 [Mycena venus]|uniref:Holliday junction resolvase Gen1 C-terminal domain-containing protein n=1 Tax=Mycena venus TaxID=2733690 RepID=A0A8H7CJV6_9AGAR|nr:hypothetical protein MVEN_01941200 [Mycena venus]